MVIHAQESYQNHRKIEELESIRGLAALLVVFYHVPKWSSFLDIGIINNAYLMVDLFFVLSGYVIYTSYAQKIANKNDLFRFQFLRFGRLYPVHFIFLMLFFFYELVKQIAQNKFGISPSEQPFTVNNFTAFIQQLFLVQAVGPTDNAFTFNYPAWSISVEFYTYLVFGLCMLFAAKNKKILFHVIAGVSLILLATKTTLGFQELLRCLAGFFIGCLTVVVTEKLKTNFPKYASLLAFGSVVFFLQLKTSSQYDIAIYFLSAVLIASVVHSKKGYLNYVLNLRVLIWLGSISYSLYMSHSIILTVMAVAIHRVLKKPKILINEKLVSQLNTIEALAACGILLIILLPVSVFVCRFIEKPIREKSRLFVFRLLK